MEGVTPPNRNVADGAWPAFAIHWVQGNNEVLWWLAASSLFTFVVTLIAVPWLIVRIPPDYFARPRRERPSMGIHSLIARAALRVVKNVVGYLFVTAGLVMLILPGQGVLTIFVGVVLADFPGKDRLVKWIISRSSVLRSINWLRHRAGRDPLVLDE